MNIKGTLFENKWQLFKKSSIPPVNPSECLYLKGSQDFYPSLELSRHLSHIPPVTIIWLRKGAMKGGIWEGLKKSLPCLNPFAQRDFQRFRER